ncbi:MAG: GNAT family N-acetyltransferase [Proteobacteria bacterium]|nr:GNAT family N-acetyltransferase [Pseudomonadota bacterium]
MTIEAGPAELYTTRARAADVPALVELVNGAYRGEKPPRGWSSEAGLIAGRRLEPAAAAALVAGPASAVLVVRAQSGLFGAVALRGTRPQVAEVEWLAVRPSLQGNGLGRALLETAGAWARAELGAATLELAVLAPREELLAWLERRGFAPTGERRVLPTAESFGEPRAEGLTLDVLARALAA